MSCYMVSDDDITYLCQAMADYDLTGGGTLYYLHGETSRELKTDVFDDLERAGQMLLAACRDSVKARYPHHPEDWEHLDPTAFKLPPRALWSRFDPVQVIKSIRHYQYQSCEASTWNKSQARALTDALLVRAACKVEGYKDAAWGSPTPDRAISGSRRA